MGKLFENWQKYLFEGEKHLEVDILIKYSKDLALYTDIFNKVRAISGVTIVKSKAETKKIGPTKKITVLTVRFMPKNMPVATYRDHLRSKMLKIKDEEGDRVVGVKFTTIPKRT